ncbi:MAG: ATPase, T2SS/T4P/T4SS family [Candidatus Omnitrophica bacterium]|nr:ATPase, T2SS/T4P/T4SS family [Candidatus Omnitrophota bacterium]
MRKKFTDYLLENNILSRENLEKSLSVQKEKGGSLIEVLIKLGYTNESEMLNLMSGFLGIPPIRVSDLKIPKEVLSLIPQNVAQNFQAIPIGKIGNTITVAISDPLNVIALDDLRKITGCEINPVIALFSEIKEAVYSRYAQNSSESLEEIIKDKTAENIELIKETAPQEVSQEQILRSVDEAPIIKYTDYILRRAVAEQASDVLIEPLEKTSRVRFRLDGILKEVETFPKKNHPFLISRIKVICNLNITEFRLPQEGRFRVNIANRDIDFRVSVLPTSLGEKVALRILDKNATVLELDPLGFENDVLAHLKEDSLKPHGLILACGPTGSGKTTTLYSIINHVYTPQKNIVTVEDPIEYQLRGINQVSINPVIDLSFARVLRSILRQDPNIIMIGEIRDADTADIAIKSSLTGHLVLSTLHTTTSAGSVTRLLNMGVEPFLLSSTLVGVITQRLVRKLCPKCKEEFKLPEDIRAKYSIDPKAVLYKARGCSVCFNTGYRGRTALCEYLQTSQQLKVLINSSASEPEIKKQARREGMHTLREDGFIKVYKGITTIEEVLKVSAPDEVLVRNEP